MNYISLRFIPSAVASSTPFMIVFNPHHIFIQNKYLRVTPWWQRKYFGEGVERRGDVPAWLSPFSDDILDKTFS